MIGWMVLGALGIPAATVFLARYIAQKAIEQRFNSEIEKLRHTHNTALEETKGEIARSLDRAVNFHKCEYDTIPNAWRLLHSALGDAHNIIRRTGNLIDLDLMSPDELKDFTQDLKWLSVHKTELLAASDKKNIYQKYREVYDLEFAISSHTIAHNYLVEHGVSIEPKLRDGLRSFASDIGSVLREQKTKIEIRKSGFFAGMRSEEILKLQVKADALLEDGDDRVKRLEQMIQNRLWTAGV